MNWQPIETAPKDGSDFLGWSPEYGCLVVFWYRLGDTDKGWWDDGISEGKRDDLTFWMPLPPPPALVWQNTTGKDVFVREEDGKWVVD